MSDTTIYRITSYATVPPSPVMSLVSNGTQAAIVYLNETQHSSDPNSLLTHWRLTENVDPTTPEEWLKLAMQGGAYYGYATIPAENSSLSAAVLQEQNFFQSIKNTQSDAGAQTDLADKISQIVLENPELDEFLAHGEGPSEPAGMREYIRTVLEAHNAIDLNPGLADWLNGGDPPPQEVFDGLVFWPESESDNG